MMRSTENWTKTSGGKGDGKEKLKECVGVVQSHVEGFVKDDIEPKSRILVLQ